MTDETLNAARIHGRLQEALHTAGYTFERAMGSMDWLIAEDNWKLAGFESPASFIASLDFSKLRLSVEQRKTFAVFASAHGVSQRLIANSLGVAQDTVRSDLERKRSKTNSNTNESNGSEHTDERNRSLGPWTDLQVDGTMPAQRSAKQEAKHVAAIATAENIRMQNADLPIAARRYGVIYADPPWNFEAYSGKGDGRHAKMHYPTMTLSEIAALPVDKLAAEDCALFIWVIMPMLPHAFTVIEAWGFKYSTCAFVWVKQNPVSHGMAIGLGKWTRANAELCLLATRGSPHRLNADVHQVIVSPREEHSRKPEEAALRVQRLVAGPYLEMFARAERDGWDVWGNQSDENNWG